MAERTHLVLLRGGQLSAAVLARRSFDSEHDDPSFEDDVESADSVSIGDDDRFLQRFQWFERAFVSFDGNDLKDRPEGRSCSSEDNVHTTRWMPQEEVG